MYDIHFIIYDHVLERYLSSSQRDTARFHTWILQEFQWLEFFAGVGNLTKMMKASNHRSMRFDLEDNTRPSYRNSNFMDLLHSSGWANLAQCLRQTVSWFSRFSWLVLRSLDCFGVLMFTTYYFLTHDFYTNYGPSYQGWVSTPCHQQSCVPFFWRYAWRLYDKIHRCKRCKFLQVELGVRQS